MDKIPVPDFTLVTSIVDPLSVSEWFEIETCEVVEITGSHRALLEAQGWKEVDKKWTADGYNFKFQRNVLKIRETIDAIVEEYRVAFNKGVSDNNERYDDIITLWTNTIDKSEDEFTLREADDSVYKDYVNTLVAQMVSDYNSYYYRVNGIFDSYGDSMEDAVNDASDIQLSAREDDLVSSGFYNAFTAGAMTTRVESERTEGLNKVNDMVTDKKLNVEERLYQNVYTFRSKLLEAKERLAELLNSHSITRLDMRNRLVELLNNFVERRTDTYPNLSDITAIATNLGGGNPGGFKDSD